MKNKEMTYTVYRKPEKGEFLDSKLIILYLLEGQMTIDQQDEHFKMNTGDIILVNPGVTYSISDVHNALYGAAAYSLQLTTSLLDSRQAFFYINSVAETSRTYEDLRTIFRELTALYAENSHQTTCLTDSLLLKLFDCIVENYQIKKNSVSDISDNSDGRMQEIMQYIMAHLDQDMSLNELADSMYVSPSTLSRIFKKNTGMYFADYVLQLRVQSSLGLLSYSDKTITQIALTCGFSNSATFNRAFKKIMDITPSDYRTEYKKKAAEDSDNRKKQEDAVRRDLIEKGYQNINEEKTLNIKISYNNSPENPLKKSWCEMINIGPIWDLTTANVQQQTLYLCENLKFRYVRLWNVFSKKMLITSGATIGRYNYDIIDQVLDFLVQHKIKPFLDLGRRPNTALRSYSDQVFYEEQYIEFVSKKHFESMVEDFLEHIAERYGIDEVSDWIFELSQDCFHPDQYNYRDERFDFFEVYKFLYEAVRRHIPGARFGGIGHDILVDNNYLIQFFHRCLENDIKPDFLSFIVFPYEDQKVLDGDWKTRLSQNDFYENYQIDCIHKLMDQISLSDTELYITEWNNSISNRNPLNDSSYRAAYLVHRLNQFSEKADMIGIMSGTDWVSSYMDTSGIANGGIGLLTRDMIRKPAYFALAYLNELGGIVLGRGENYIATKRKNGDVYILFFYYSKLKEYYLNKEEDLGLKEYAPGIFEHEQRINISVSVDNMEKAGDYCLKKRTINPESGSLLEEWGKLQYETRLMRKDVKYIEAICIPSLSMTYGRVEDPVRILKFEVTLLPHEITVLHIFRRR